MSKVKNKTKVAFQAVSQCNTESDRDILTKKISEFMIVTYVGKCDGIESIGDCHKCELGEKSKKYI